METLANCGKSVNAELVSNYCARDDEADIYCGTAESYPALLGTALGACDATISRGESCSGDCRSTLMFIRSELGCCTNAFFNNTLYAFLAPVLSYDLWSSCDVDQPNSTCDGALPYTIPANPIRTCTPDELNACRVGDQAVIQNAAPAGCEAIIDYNRARCAHFDSSEDGLCSLDLLDDFAGPITTIGTNCATAVATQSCSSSCKTSLQNFVDSRGCCVNTLFNSTSTIVTGLSALPAVQVIQNSMLFNVCSVEPPPLMCPPITDGSLPLKSFSLMTLLSVIITALLGNKI